MSMQSKAIKCLLHAHNLSFKNALFLLLFSFCLIHCSLALAAADCRPAYQRQLEQRRQNNDKGKYEVVLKLINFSLATPDHAELADFADRLRKKHPRYLENIDAAAVSKFFIEMNHYGLLCQDKKPIAIHPLIDNFLKLRRQLSTLKRQEFVTKNAHVFLSPKNFLLAHQKQPEIDINLSDVEQFLKMSPRPTLKQLLALRKFNLFEIDFATLLSLGEQAQIPQNPAEHILLATKLAGRKAHPAVLESFFAFFPRPTLDQIIKFSSQFANFKIVQDYAVARGVIKDPEDFLRLYRPEQAEAKVHLTISELNHFFALNPRPTLGQIVSLANFHQNPLRVREMAFTKKFVKTPQEFLDLFQGAEDGPISAKLIRGFFSMRPAPTLKQVIELTRLHSNNLLATELAYINNFVHTPQDVIDLYQARPDHGTLLSSQKINLFFASHPTLSQISELARIHYYQSEITDQAIRLKLIHTPQDLIDLYAKVTHPTSALNLITLFFSMRPAPTLQQIVALTKVRRIAPELRVKALDDGLIQTPQDFLDLFLRAFGYELTKEKIEFFIGLNPSPTLKQLLILNRKLENKLPLDIALVLKEKVKNAQDFIDLHEAKSFDLTPPKIKLFAHFLPSMTEIGQLINNASPTEKVLLENYAKMVMNQNNSQALKDMSEQVSKKLQRKISSVKKAEHKNPQDFVSVCQRKLTQDNPQIAYYQMWPKLHPLLRKQYQQIPIFKEVTEVKECPVCLLDKTGPFFQCTQSLCPYTACADCTAEGIQLQLKEKTLPLKCEQCAHEIPVHQKDFQLMDMQKAWKNFQKQSQLYAHQTLFPKARQCKTPDCINLITDLGPNSQQHYKCLACKATYCRKCDEHHEGQDCIAHRESKKSELEIHNMSKAFNSLIHPCPFCEHKFSKDTACTTVTCPWPGCKKRKWDWIEGRVIEVRHRFNKDHLPRQYLMAGEIHPLTGEVCTEYTYIGNEPGNQMK